MLDFALLSQNLFIFIAFYENSTKFLNVRLKTTKNNNYLLVQQIIQLFSVNDRLLND
jgi:hypothetical protein